MYATIDELRHRYEVSKTAQAYRLNFYEYAVIYRIYEGMNNAEVPDSFFISQPTLSRYRQSLIKKFRVNFFSQLLLKLGVMHLIEGQTE